MLLRPTSSLLPQICGQGDPIKARSHRHVTDQGRCHHVITVESVNTPTSPHYDGLQSKRSLLPFVCEHDEYYHITMDLYMKQTQ